ncbi:MAG: hypothetical protein QOE82_1521 [Thermoanaerobaculia bacterium]|nr:hypothetical protein [Thermoanaerobaculia bacterium]
MSDDPLGDILPMTGWLDDVLRRAVASVCTGDYVHQWLEAGATMLGERAPSSASRTRLDHLAEVFELGDFERCVVILCLAPELDRRYERIYAYLNGDGHAAAPTVSLALTLFCADFGEQVAARAAFQATAPLSRWLLADSSEAATLARPLRLAPRVTAWLLGDDTLDELLQLPLLAARWLNPREKGLLWSDALQSHLIHLSLLVQNEEPLCILEGPPGSGRKSFAEAVCRARGIPLLTCDAASLTDARVTAVFRELRLYRAALHLDGAMSPEMAMLVASELDRWPGLLFTTDAFTTQRRSIHIPFAVPDESIRRELWLRHADAPESAARLGARFRFTPGQIEAAATLADSREESDLTAACRQLASRQLVSFAVKVAQRRGWDDLVLPKSHLEQLAELAGHVRDQSRVYDEWGFHAKVSASRGIVALFSGAPGTGKTLSAEVVARDLGLDLFRIDLASLISKYIGETEKNLARVFDEGERSGGILFFDEADAVFGKRSEVRDAHDRYANIETSYLLQRIEDYPGLVILATNMGRNIDAAFQRRMSLVIDFPLPDAGHRRRIWRGMFPPAAPVDGIDFDFLSERFPLSGGHIRNIAVAAAFRAAGNGGIIGMEHVLLSLKREYQKMGKVCERSEFGDYYHLVR